MTKPPLVVLLLAAGAALIRPPGLADTPAPAAAFRPDAHTMLLLPMDEPAWNGTANEVRDLSGNGNHGTACGVTNGTADTVPEGRFGRAGRFDGIDDSLDVICGGVIGPDFTVEAWIKPEGTGGSQFIFSTAQNNAFALKIENHQLVFVYHNGTSYQRVWTDAAAGGWLRVAAAGSDAAGMRLYVNGELKASNPAAGGVRTHNTLSYLGSCGGKSGFFHGLIDEVRISTLDRFLEAPVAAPAPADDPAAARQPGANDAPPAPDYLALVKAYADALIAGGRDTYGHEHSPLFAAALDRKTLRIGPGAAFQSIEGIREYDRSLSGANPMHDQNLYQILYALAAITGEPSYAREADAALAWFFTHCQSPKTGLMTWGEHLYWDFEKEARGGDDRNHEFFRPWVLWDTCWALAPGPSEAFARGLWNHQIGDPETGRFSRHARWSDHGPATGMDFPRHGGFFIDAWSRAYARTKDPVFLKAIRTLAALYGSARNERTGMIPSVTEPVSRTGWPLSNLSLAIDLWAAAGRVPDELARELRRQALETDRVFLKIAHDVGRGGQGFVLSCRVHNIEPLGRSARWTTGYGEHTDAQVANLCALRYGQLPDGPSKAAYRRLILACAGRYLDSSPDRQKPIYPGAVGDAILHLADAHAIAGDTRYLERADALGRLAASLFFDGASPLPKASTLHSHYEAITRADTLMMAFLELWQKTHRSGQSVRLVYSDR